MSKKEKKITETWHTYDDKGNIISIKSTAGWKTTYELTYDDKGRVIKEVDSDGEIDIYAYDENDNEIYHKSSPKEAKDIELYGFEEWSGYDDKGNLIWQKWKDGCGIQEQWLEYDDDNNKEIYSKEIDYPVEGKTNE